MNKFTFDTIHRDGKRSQFLIRYATPKEIENEIGVWDTYKDCKDVLSGTMKNDIFVSVNIIEATLDLLK